MVELGGVQEVWEHSCTVELGGVQEVWEHAWWSSAVSKKCGSMHGGARRSPRTVGACMQSCVVRECRGEACPLGGHARQSVVFTNYDNIQIYNTVI